MNRTSRDLTSIKQVRNFYKSPQLWYHVTGYKVTLKITAQGQLYTRL